jgi:saccharopepsin
MTKLSATTLASCLLVLSSVADVRGLHLSLERRVPKGISLTSPLRPSRPSFSSSSDKEAIENKDNMRYATTISINGHDVAVAIDTGSTDLWVNPPGGVGTFNDSKIPVELLYGDGSYGAKGTIGVAPFKFGAYSVPNQAFLNVVESTITGLDEIEVYGILGLSFDLATASHIDDAVKKVDGPDAKWGQSVLSNIFEAYPDLPNLVAIDLSRSEDLEDTQGGSLYIGEYDPKWAAVAQAPKLAQYPVGATRWTTLLEGITVDGTAITMPASAVDGVPSGQMQALLDTGDPNAGLPTEVMDGIFSHVSGAVKYSEDGTPVWIVPCKTTAIVELEFGDQKFPIHPLDLSNILKPVTLPDGTEVTVCTSAFRYQDGTAQQGFEIALGDSFLRNIYSVYDFGDGANGTPYMQFLTEIDTTKAIAQVESIRGKTLAGLPAEMAPADLVKLLTGGGGDVPSPTATHDPVEPTGDANLSEGKGPKVKGSIDTAEGNNSLNLSVSDEAVKKYGLIALILLGANVAIGLILIGFSIASCIRRGRSSKRSVVSAGPPQYAPVKLQEDYSTPSYGYQQPYGQ